MAKLVPTTMTVSQGTILNYGYDIDLGYAAALLFSGTGYDLPPASLFNNGEMNFRWDDDVGACIFLYYEQGFQWDLAVAENRGTITMSAVRGSLARLFFSPDRLPHITNYGTITVQAKNFATVAEGWSYLDHITNAAGGVMRATAAEKTFGLYLVNGATVENAGQIIAKTTGPAYDNDGAVGICMVNGPGFGHRLYNSGLIEASDADAATKKAMALVASHATLTITNDGTLRGDYSIWAEESQATIVNNNLMQGDIWLGGQSSLTNNGTITGLVDLSDDNDLYDGRLGTVSGDVHGYDGYDRLYGGAGIERLYGDAGEDRIWGGGGADDLDGGAGADLFVYTAASDSTASARDRIRAFQTGIDLIELRYLGVGDISWTQQSDGTGGFNIVTVNTANGPLSIRVDGALALSDFAIVEDRQIIGTAADDTLTGGAGNDLLDGLGGADRMAGGTGNDTYRVDNAGDVIVEAVGKYYDTAVDTVLASASYALTAGASIEFMAASDAAGLTSQALTGNEFDQTITGNAGANSLAGGGGADILVGLGGDDIYYLDNATTGLREAVGGGVDTLVVRTAMSYQLAAGVEIERLTLADDTGPGFVTIMGNEFDQILLGNAGANGLYGGGGNDRLIGGAGADSMSGDAGSDVYVYLNVSDSVAGSADMIGLDGADFVDLTAVHATAVSWPSTQVVVGDSGIGPIFGYIVTVETAGGNMTIKAVGHPLRTDFLLGGETMGTAGNDTIEGTAASNVISGLDGNDRLFGYAGNDFLAGQAGDDVIDGGSGADQMAGGLGADTYYVDDPNDVVWEGDNGGAIDTVIASISYALTTDSLIEILRTADDSGLAAINFTGNQAANLIIGNAGDNVIDGGADPNPYDFSFWGPDVLRGLGGNDTYYVDANSTVEELAGQGNDVVYARNSYALGAGISVETLALADSSSAISYALTGNEFSQKIIGNAGNNLLRGNGGDDVLLGGAGNDQLVGGRGNDRLEGGAGADSFIFETAGDSQAYALRSDGHKYMPDIIADFTSGTDKIDIAGIDAIVGTAANDAFTFIGTGAFTHQAGQLRYEASGNFTSILGDTDGDGIADFQLLCATPVTLTAADFVL